MSRKTAGDDRRSHPVVRDRLPVAWREHARAKHLELIARWVGAPSGRWLKTDLFEELQESRALIPRLPSGSWTGIDISADVAESSSDRTWATAVMDLRSLAFADGVFDGVLSTSTLDHFTEERDLHRALAELRRVIRPGGRLIVTLDNPDNPLINLRNRMPDRVAARTGLVPYPAGFTLSRREGAEALRAAGFQVEDAEYLLHVPHIVGTRLVHYRWFRLHAVGLFDKLGRTQLARWSGHYVAFSCRAGG